MRWSKDFKLSHKLPLDQKILGSEKGYARAKQSAPRERSAPAKRRTRERVGESEGRSLSDKLVETSASVVECAFLMATVPFGQFSLLDFRGEDSGVVVIAPELILLRRSRSAAVHDLSYLVVWSEPRTAAVRRELQTLVRAGQQTVDGSTPEVRQVLLSIEPKATAVFRRGGSCSRIFRRRQLKAALDAAGRPRATERAS